MNRLFKSWRVQTRGATAIEYSLIIVGIALAVSLFIFSFGGNLSAFFDSLAAALDGGA